jgi:hypothetical protein
MRIGSMVGCSVIALCCAGCAGSIVLPKNNFAWGEPAGFYPGRAIGGNLGSEYSAWLAKNQTGIADVQNRIVEIKNGARVPGCIGQDKYTCVATLSQRLTVADDWADSDSNVFPNVKYDVNGKPLNGSSVMLSAFFPNGRERHDGGETQLILTIDSGGSVSHITAMLPHDQDPLLAHTQEQYDKTQVYEIVAAVTARTCPSLSSPEVARWIENVVKPGLAHEKPHSLDEGESTIRAESFTSKATVFCGRTFVFSSAGGYYREGFQRVPFEGAMLDIQ